LLINLKDTASVGDNHEFRGFKTGECTLSVSFSRIAKEKASVLILNVDGNELSEVSNIDKTAPNIIVDFADYNKNELPYGIVGRAYKVFDYVAYDVFGFVEYSDVRVYSKQGQEKTYFSVVNDRFVPTKRGLYYLEYTAIDDCGNESNEIVSITVLNDGEFVAPDYTFGDFEEEYFVGEEIKIPQGEIFEGDFKATQEIKVFFGGKEIDVDANSFLPLAAGKYRIQVALKTYAKTFSFEKEIC
jgi:hypothetical protein